MLTSIFDLKVVINNKLLQGQRVLIHGGAGGVGLMAIEYAKKIGCEIIATG